MAIRPYLIVFAVGSLTYSYYFMYVQQRGQSHRNTIMLWVSTAIAAAFISVPYWLHGDWELGFLSF